MDSLTLYLKQLEKEEQRKSKVSRRKEIIKIRADINEVEMRKMIAKINKSRSLFFERINKTDKSLARLLKKKVNKSRNEKGDVDTKKNNRKRIKHPINSIQKQQNTQYFQVHTKHSLEKIIY